MAASEPPIRCQTTTSCASVTSNTAVIRKAIALARIASRTSNAEDKTVTLVDKTGAPLKISLAG